MTQNRKSSQLQLLTATTATGGGAVDCMAAFMIALTAVDGDGGGRRSGVLASGSCQVKKTTILKFTDCKQNTTHSQIHQFLGLNSVKRCT